jgi:hypothetical protein
LIAKSENREEIAKTFARIRKILTLAKNLLKKTLKNSRNLIDRKFAMRKANCFHIFVETNIFAKTLGCAKRGENGTLTKQFSFSVFYSGMSHVFLRDTIFSKET